MFISSKKSSSPHKVKKMTNFKSKRAKDDIEDRIKLIEESKNFGQKYENVKELLKQYIFNPDVQEIVEETWGDPKKVIRGDKLRRAVFESILIASEYERRVLGKDKFSKETDEAMRRFLLFFLDYTLGYDIHWYLEENVEGWNRFVKYLKKLEISIYEDIDFDEVVYKFNKKWKEKGVEYKIDVWNTFRSMWHKSGIIIADLLGFLMRSEFNKWMQDLSVVIGS